jgi:hypothetical protein
MNFFLNRVLHAAASGSRSGLGAKEGPVPLRARPAPVAAGRAGRPTSNATTIAFRSQILHKKMGNLGKMLGHGLASRHWLGDPGKSPFKPSRNPHERATDPAHQP